MSIRRKLTFAEISPDYIFVDPAAEPSHILEKIVWQKEREVTELQHQFSPINLTEKLKQCPPPRNFLGPLQNPTRRPALIAEVKKASPSKGIFRTDFDPVAIAQEYVAGGANCLSVLTDTQFFQGGFTNLQIIRQAVDIPLLCKDFIIHPSQIYWARLHGADAILLITAILNDRDLENLQSIAHQLHMAVLVEVHTAAELDRVLKIPQVQLIGINNRDLTNFTVNLSQTGTLLGTVTKEQLLSYTWVSESGIYTSLDLQTVSTYGANAVLVGESLIKQENLPAAIDQLYQGR